MKSELRVSQNLPVRPVPAAARCRLAWVYLLVVARLTLIPKVIRVKADVRVIAINIIQPDFMMDDLAQLIPAHLAQPAINGPPVCNVPKPSPAPCLALVKFLLCHIVPCLLSHRKRTGFLAPVLDAISVSLSHVSFHTILFHCVPLCIIFVLCGYTRQ